MTDILLTQCGGEALLITEPSSLLIAGMFGVLIGAALACVAVIIGERRK